MAPLVCAIGDLLLDVVCRPQAPLDPDTDTPSIVRADAGGQAANVAAWAVAAGARGRLITLQPDDPGGRLALQLMATRGVEVLGPTEAGRCGIVVVLVAPDGGRSMLTDRGSAADLSPDAVDAAWLAGVDVLHVTGYALAGGALQAAAARAAALVGAAGGRVAVELSSTAMIDALGADVLRARMLALRPDAVLGTAAELARLGGAAALAGDVRVVLEKRGPDGALVHAEGRTHAFAAAPVADVVDTTGAGDALAGAFHAAWAAGADPADALAGALPFAARCIARMGAQP